MLSQGRAVSKFLSHQQRSCCSSETLVALFPITTLWAQARIHPNPGTGMGVPGVLRPLNHLLLLLLLPEESRGSRAGTHTLRYDLVALAPGGPGKAQFLALGYFDDELFMRYDGESRRAEPRGLGIRTELRAETWERETEDLIEKERQLRLTLAEIMGQQGQGQGLHSLQATLGCELQRDLSTRGFWRLGYNGQDILTFDSETLTWTVDAHSAQHIKKLWETRGPRADLAKIFLYETCPAQLWRYLASWRGLLEKTAGSRQNDQCPASYKNEEGRKDSGDLLDAVLQLPQPSDTVKAHKARELQSHPCRNDRGSSLLNLLSPVAVLALFMTLCLPRGICWERGISL
nr:MHC class I-like protein MILL1 isoform X3 [Equus asinus]